MCKPFCKKRCRIFSPIIRILCGWWHSVISARRPIWLLLLLLLLLTIRLITLLRVGIVAAITHREYLDSSSIPFKWHRRIVRCFYENTVSHNRIGSFYACTAQKRLVTRGKSVEKQRVEMSCVVRLAPTWFEKTHLHRQNQSYHALW